MLGAVTDDGDSFYCWTEESLTADHGIQLLEALVEDSVRIWSCFWIVLGTSTRRISGST